MKTTVRLVEMLLRGKTDQFKTVMQEELEWRASVLMEKLYKIECQNIFKTTKIPEIIEESAAPILTPNSLESSITQKFIPETTYYLKDGNIGILNESEKQLISKLYEKLNNDNKERILKLLSESKETFNRVLNLAKTEDKK